MTTGVSQEDHQLIILVYSQNQLSLSHPPAWNQGSQSDPTQEAASPQKTICSVYSLNITKLGKTSVLANTNRPGSTACFGAVCLYIYLCFLWLFFFFLMAIEAWTKTIFKPLKGRIAKRLRFLLRTSWCSLLWKSSLALLESKHWETSSTAHFNSQLPKEPAEH